MDGEVLRVVLVSLLFVGAALWFVTGFMVRASGTWIRELSDEDWRAGERPETIELKAVGPLVSGQSHADGGRQEYNGYLIGRTLHLKRRDHGVRYLQQQGYPKAIAEKRDGEESASMKLRVDGEFLIGEFFPFKVEYTHQPPRVTQVLPMSPTARRYTRFGTVSDQDLVPTDAEEPAEIA